MQQNELTRALSVPHEEKPHESLQKLQSVFDRSLQSKQTLNRTEVY